jgi:hypothetical protein
VVKATQRIVLKDRTSLSTFSMTIPHAEDAKTDNTATTNNRLKPLVAMISLIAQIASTTL